MTALQGCAQSPHSSAAAEGLGVPSQLLTKLRAGPSPRARGHEQHWELVSTAGWHPEGSAPLSVSPSWADPRCLAVSHVPSCLPPIIFCISPSILSPCQLTPLQLVSCFPSVLSLAPWPHLLQLQPGSHAEGPRGRSLIRARPNKNLLCHAELIHRNWEKTWPGQSKEQCTEGQSGSVPPCRHAARSCLSFLASLKSFLLTLLKKTYILGAGREKGP